jgi:hypothetical protein
MMGRPASLWGTSWPCGDWLVLDLDDLGEAAAHHAQVVLHHALALAAELGPATGPRWPGTDHLSVEAGALHQGEAAKKAPWKAIALHAQLEFHVGGLVTGDLEAIDVEDRISLSMMKRRAWMGKVAHTASASIQAGLDDEDAALLQAREWGWNG